MAVQSIFFSIALLTILKTHSFVINKFVFQALYIWSYKKERWIFKNFSG